MKKRSIDISKMGEQQIEELSTQLGAKITNTLKKPLEDIQKLLDVYGLDIEFGYNVRVKESQTTEG